MHFSNLVLKLGAYFVSAEVNYTWLWVQALSTHEQSSVSDGNLRRARERGYITLKMSSVTPRPCAGQGRPFLLPYGLSTRLVEVNTPDGGDESQA